LSNIRHVLFSTIKLTNFSDIGQQILFMFPWWLFIIRKKIFILAIYCFLIYIFSPSLDTGKNNALCKYHFAICILLLCIREASWYCRKLQTIKSATSHGSMISLADLLGRPNHASGLRVIQVGQLYRSPDICFTILLSRRQTIDKVGQLLGRGLVSKDNRPMKSLNNDTRHLSRHDSDDKKWQTMRTPTLLCCFIFWLWNNIKSGPYGSAVGYSTGK